MRETKEYVLYQLAGENRQPLYSDTDLDVVKAHKTDAIRDAFARGLARPEFTITCRHTTHPLDKSGNPQATGSTCDETEV